MTERVTRSQTGRTPSKPSKPGFVETPGRKKYTRKSILHGRDDSETPEASIKIEDEDEGDFLSSRLALNGHGHTNGFPNEYPNGSANGSGIDLSNGIAKKQGKTAQEDSAKNFGPIDPDPKREFGGSFGMLAMMIGFPSLMYYMWIGQTFYNGNFPRPAEDESFRDFFFHLVTLVKENAYPSNRAWSIYWYFGLLQMAFYMLLPGVYRKGKSLPHLGGKQLDYYCSAMWSYYTTIAIALTLHFTGYFKLYTIIDEFGPIMSVAIISGFLCSFIAYFSAIARGATMRMTGWPIVDFFLGAELNPRLFGILDFKMFLEVRIPWFTMTFLALGAALRQYERHGYVSAEAFFIVFAQWLYANACAKGEHMIITTWDMYYEKLGFMLIFWNMAGVPFSYCQPMLFIANHHPDEFSWPLWFIVPLTIAYFGVYYIWDTCNSQKNQFRQEERGTVMDRKTFPYFSYGKIKNPKTIQTKQGSKLLVDGWYGKARKVHYTCDLFFAICWGLITGFKSPFPWFYSVFFFFMILHRANRDIQRCHETYGEAWEEYTRQVPYLFIPYVF